MNRLNLGRFVKKYVFLYLFALVAMLFSTWLDMIAPLIVRHIIDDVLLVHNLEPLKYLLLGILAIGVGRCICQYIKEYVCDWCGSKIASEIRINLFQKIQSLSANFFDGINSGELMSRVKDDVDHIWDIAAFMGILMAEVIFRTGITMYYLLRMNWKISLLPILGMIGTGVIAIFMEQKLDKVYGDIAQENSELNNTAAENLAGVRTVKAFAREDFERKKFHKHNQKYYELNIEQSNIFVYYNPMIQAITRIMPAVTLLLGGLAVIAGTVTDMSQLSAAEVTMLKFAGIFKVNDKMSIGELIAIVQYVGGMMWPMEMIGWLTNGFSSAKASVKRLDKIYAETPSINDNSKLTDEKELEDVIFTQDDISGNISFENVTYTAGGRNILDNVSFNLKAGETLGIMGATGSGKTTIINLLKRMYDVTSGSIKLDGVDIKEIPLAALRRSIACVMQDVFLFSDTIDGNIRLGEKEMMSEPTVRMALEKAQASEFVDKMPDGIETVIGERGVGLSGGQKQRLTIARALAHKTPVLVLDDSTSALDTETEQEIQGVLNNLEGMTKIIIGHRISSVRKANKIIVLEDGKIAEQGTHEELIKSGGLYKETYDSQH